ncbi:MAG: hypothetical protein Tsb004_23370 [Allomuricauda sp.]
MKEFFQNSVCSRQWAVGSVQSALGSEQWAVGSLQFSVSSLFKGLKALLPANCLFFCCLLISCQLSNAQIFPVQVTPQVLPPYSFRLSDYATSTREKLFVNLLLTDAMESGRRVRLRMNVEGPGISFRTVDFVVGAPPIVLNGGVNLRLSNFDLRPYFELNNLIGISPQQYGQQLPEGQYRICFEVYDQFSGQRISNNSCANIYLLLNDPPLLNLPFRGDIVTAQQPQNLIFNWTPRHINAPGVQYEFTLKELWDTGMDPQASFFAAPPLYQTTTFANMLHYGPAQTPLLEGRTYGWQVRAFVSDGFTESSLFRNNGMSEVYHFTYRADCHPPRFVLSEAQNARTVRITWQMGEQLRYRVQYRKKGYGDGDWFGLWSRTSEGVIRNLEPGTVYEFRVGGDCSPLLVSPKGGEGSGDGISFSPIHEFTTPIEDEMAYYNCGIPPEIEIANQEPLLNLGVNEVFTAGDFPVVVREATGSNGYYTGWGYITLPFLENIKEVVDVANVVSGGQVNLGKLSRIRVEFENIKINTDYQLVEGMVETSYDPNWSGIVDVDQAIKDIGDLLELLSDELNSIVATLKENWELNRQVDAAIEILETNLEDPNNGLTDAQEENIRNFIADRDRVKQTIIEEKEKIANGERDEVIKQNLASHFVDKEETKSNISKEFEIYHCDSIVKLDKRNDIVKECNKLRFIYKKEDTTATKTVQMKLKVVPNDEGKDRFFPSKDGWQSVKYNEDWEVDFDSIPSGEYLAELKVNDSIYKHEFRMQKECTSGYCCEVCGRDLTITQERLKSIYPKASISIQDATDFNTALKKAKFNTCTSHAHFFSQTGHETLGFTKFEENLNYDMPTLLKTFRYNKFIGEFFKQEFWSDKTYKDYFWVRVKEKKDTIGGLRYNYLEKEIETYKWKAKNLAKASDTIRFPTSFSYKKQNGTFAKVTFSNAEKLQRKKKLFSKVYQKINGNGNEISEDGYKYIGRGAIHLTGRGNYRSVSEKCNEFFKTSYDWEENPKNLLNNKTEIIYSAVAYYLYRLNENLSILNEEDVKVVSRKVNGGTNGLNDRRKRFNVLKNGIYVCKKK